MKVNIYRRCQNCKGKGCFGHQNSCTGDLSLDYTREACARCEGNDSLKEEIGMIEIYYKMRVFDPVTKSMGEPTWIHVVSLDEKKSMLRLVVNGAHRATLTLSGVPMEELIAGELGCHPSLIIREDEQNYNA